MRGAGKGLSLSRPEVARERPGGEREYPPRLGAPSPLPAAPLPPPFPPPRFVYIGSGSWEALPTPCRRPPSLPGLPHVVVVDTSAVSAEGRRLRVGSRAGGLAWRIFPACSPPWRPHSLQSRLRDWVPPPSVPCPQGRLKTALLRCSWRLSGFAQLPEKNGNMNSGA